MTHSCACWLESSVPCHVDLATGWLECPRDTAAGLPRASDPRERARKLSAFYDLVSEVTDCHPHHTVCTRSESLNPPTLTGRGTEFHFPGEDVSNNFCGVGASALGRWWPGPWGGWWRRGQAWLEIFWEAESTRLAGGFDAEAERASRMPPGFDLSRSVGCGPVP